MIGKVFARMKPTNFVGVLYNLEKFDFLLPSLEVTGSFASRDARKDISLTEGTVGPSEKNTRALYLSESP